MKACYPLDSGVYTIPFLRANMHMVQGQYPYGKADGQNSETLAIQATGKEL